MSERKYNKEEPLNALISIRVPAALYDKLEAQRQQSNCQSLGQFARKILSEKPIIWIHRDATLDGVAAELAAIKKQLNSIGTNINQVTRYFNSTSLPSQKTAILAQQADVVVQLYEAASTAKLSILRNIQLGFLFFALVLLVGGAWVTRQSVLKPLSELGVAAENLGGNDLVTPVQVQGTEEVRRLSQSFDGMRLGLKSAQQDLIDLNETLEKRVSQRTSELEALNIVSQEITSRLDIQQVLSSVTKKTSELLNGDVSFLCLLDANQQESYGLSSSISACPPPAPC